MVDGIAYDPTPVAELLLRLELDRQKWRAEALPLNSTQASVFCVAFRKSIM